MMSLKGKRKGRMGREDGERQRKERVVGGYPPRLITGALGTSNADAIFESSRERAVTW